MDYKTVLERIGSLDSENSDLYLETVEQNLLMRHRSAGEKIYDTDADGFYTIKVVKRRIIYRTVLESVRESDNIEEFTNQVEDFYMEIKSVGESSSDELQSIFSEILVNPLEEIK